VACRGRETVEKKACPTCGGSGVLGSGVCWDCSGDGDVYRLDERQVSKKEYDDADHWEEYDDDE
jgi:DnaJ-class molecular chaperone